LPGIALGNDGNESGSITTGSIIGVSFTANAPVEVTALGLYDAIDGTGDGFFAGHTVALYRVSDQQELARITLAAGTSGTLVDRFRYVNLSSPVTLAAGARYEVAALYAPAATFNTSDGLRGGVSFTPDARLSNVTFQAEAANPGQPFTDVHYTGSPIGAAFFGPNVLVTVPEPFALPVAGLLLTGTFLRRRRAR
jgi:hypothetical protein